MKCGGVCIILVVKIFKSKKKKKKKRGIKKENAKEKLLGIWISIIVYYAKMNLFIICPYFDYSINFSKPALIVLFLS